MTALNLRLSSDTYEHLLEDYLRSRQFQPAFEILVQMKPTTIALTRFLHACCECRQMVQADKAWNLMKSLGIVPTSVAYNLMIRCLGRTGNVKASLSILEEMKELGLEITEDTCCSLLEAHLEVCELDGCVRIFKDTIDAGYIVNLHRLRKLIHALCIDRRVEDAFEVFDLAVSVEVDGDLQVCSDLIDLAKECNCPERVPPVFQCMVRKAVRLDIGRSHVLISQLSQVDELSEAMTVLNWLPFSAQRANAETYMQLVGTCLRAGLGDEGMRVIKEFSQVAPSDKRPSLYFYNFCLRGYRGLKSPTSCQAIMELIWKEDQIDPDYESYSELICANLEARRFKPALVALNQMTKAGFQPQAALSNVYIVCLASSKALQHHDLAWAMYSSQTAQGVRIEGHTHATMFDSCVAHARITRTLEVGFNMEAARATMGTKRLEQLKRARAIIVAVGAQGEVKHSTTGSKILPRPSSSNSRPNSPAVSASSPRSAAPRSPGISQRLPRLRAPSLPSTEVEQHTSPAASDAASPKHLSASASRASSRRPSSRASMADSRGARSSTALSQASTVGRRSVSRSSTRSFGGIKPMPVARKSASPLPPLPSAEHPARPDSSAHGAAGLERVASSGDENREQEDAAGHEAEVRRRRALLGSVEDEEEDGEEDDIE